MMLEDLDHIFEPQIKEGTTNLYFMLIDGDALPSIQRCEEANLALLLPMLDAFVYDGSGGRMPRFIK